MESKNEQGTVDTTDQLKSSYTEDSLGGTNNSIQAVRQDPSRYLGSRGLRAILQMLREIVENSIDESSAILLKFLKQEEARLSISVKLLPDGTCIVKDEGRGIPVGLKDIEEKEGGLSANKVSHFKIDEQDIVWRKDFEGDLSITEVYDLPDDKFDAYIKDRPYKWIKATEYQKRIAPVMIHAMENDTFGGKGTKGASSNNDAYKDANTGGVHGAGMCVTLACCEIFEVVNTFRGDGNTYIVGYKEGNKVTRFQQIPTILKEDGTPNYGFQVKFKPDLTVLNLHDNLGRERDYPYDIPELKSLFINYAIACDRINFKFDYELPNGTKESLTYNSDDYKPEKILEKQSVTGVVFSHKFEGEDLSVPNNPIKYVLDIHYTPANLTRVTSIVNRLVTSKSTTTDAFIDTIQDAVMEEFKRTKTLNPNVPLDVDLSRNCIGAVLQLGVNNPEFSGQVKSEFHNPRLRSMLNKQLHQYFAKGEGNLFIQELYARLLPAYKRKLQEFQNAEDNKAKKQMNDFKKTSANSKLVNNRLTKPGISDLRRCFCLLVEGESGGTAMNNFLNTEPDIPEVFGFFTLTGKIVNVLTNDILKSKDKEMFAHLFNTLDSKLHPWRRIVAFTDGDVFGYHIRDLISAFMVIHFPDLVKNLRFSILQTPLSKVTLRRAVTPECPTGLEERYLFTTDAVNEHVEKYGENGNKTLVSKQDYKGIAELSFKDLKHLLELDENGNLKYEYVVKPVDGTLKPELATLTKYFGKGVGFRKSYIEDMFMTERFAMYTATRKERFADLGVNVDLDDLERDDEGVYSHGQLTTEINNDVIRDTSYLSPAEFLVTMNDKYGATQRHIEQAGTVDFDLETLGYSPNEDE